MLEMHFQDSIIEELSGVLVYLAVQAFTNAPLTIWGQWNLLWATDYQSC